MSFVERLVGFCLDHRKLTIMLSMIVAALLIAGIPGLDYSAGYKKVLGPNSPELASINEIEASYSENKNIFVMFKSEKGDVFTPQTLAAIKSFTDQAWRLPYVKRVDSLTNFQHTDVDGDDLIVNDLVEFPEQLTLHQAQKIKEIALSQKELAGFLVAHDGQSAGINIDFEVDIESAVRLREVSLATKALIADVEQQYPGVTGYTTGLVRLLYAWLEAAGQDVVVTLPIAVLAIFIGVAWFFGSISATVMTLVLCGLSIFCALGIMGYAGGLLIPITMSGVIMILILAIADSVHILSGIGKFLEQGKSKEQAITQAIVINFRAIALTSITTAIGFASFNFSEFSAIKALGNLVAVGVLSAFALSVLLLPVLLSYCNLKPSKERIKQQRYGQLADFVLRHRKLLLLATGPLFLASIWLAQLNELDDGMAKFLSKRTEFRNHTSEIEASLTGSALLLYNMDTDQPGMVNNPDYMREVDALAQWFRQQNVVRHVSSYTDVMRRLNRDMNFGDKAFETLPDNQELAAQYLLLYELSLPFGKDLTNQINLDKSGALLTVATDDLSLKEFISLNDNAVAWMKENTPDRVREASGAIYVMSRMIGTNFIEMLEGAVLALIIIGIILVFSLRSAFAGFVCIVGIVAPIVVAFSAWALVVGTVGLAAATVLSMVIGIAVDDAVHFMSKYLYATKQYAYSREEAVRYAFEHVGEALLINTVALSAGFLIMALSSFNIYSVMGLLTTITIVLALLANITLVPALLMVRFNKQKRFFIEL